MQLKYASFTTFSWEEQYKKIGKKMYGIATPIANKDTIIGFVDPFPFNVFLAYLKSSPHAETQECLIDSMDTNPKLTAASYYDNYRHLTPSVKFVTKHTFDLLHKFATILTVDAAAIESVFYANTFTKDVDVPGVTSLPDSGLKEALIDTMSEVPTNVPVQQIMTEAESTQREDTVEIKPGDMIQGDAHMFAGSLKNPLPDRVEDDCKDLETLCSAVTTLPLTDLLDTLNVYMDEDTDNMPNDTPLVIEDGMLADESLINQPWELGVQTPTGTYRITFDQLKELKYYEGDKYTLTNGRRTFTYSDPAVPTSILTSLNGIYNRVRNTFLKNPLSASSLVSNIVKKAPHVYNTIKTLGKYDDDAKVELAEMVAEGPLYSECQNRSFDSSLWSKVIPMVARLAKSQMENIGSQSKRNTLVGSMAADFRSCFKGPVVSQAKSVYVFGR